MSINAYLKQSQEELEEVIDDLDWIINGGEFEISEEEFFTHVYKYLGDLHHIFLLKKGAENND
jgi:hypothetical protein